MPGLALFRLQNRRRRRRASKDAKSGHNDHHACRTNLDAVVVGEEIILRPNKDCPLESSNQTEHTVSISSSSSTASSSLDDTGANLWPAEESSMAAPASPRTTSASSTSTSASAQVTAVDKPLPVKPVQSRWDEADFIAVVKAWDLTEVEIRHLRTLEANLDDVDHWKNNPFEVVRILRGPKGFPGAEKNFRKMVAWRLDHQVDDILQDYQPPQVLLDYCPSAMLHGLDKGGDPIYLERAGATDAPALLRQFGHAALIRHVIWLRELCGRGEWVQGHEERMGKTITQATIVYDLAGLSHKHLRHAGVLPFFCHMVQLTQDYYTSPVKRMIIIRAPAIFRVVWGVVKHCFHAQAVDKMVFTGCHNHEEILAQYIDLEVLPSAISKNFGKGNAAIGMPQLFQGGTPPSCDFESESPSVNKQEPVARSSTFLDDSFDEDDDQQLELVQAQVAVATSLLGSGSFHFVEDAVVDVTTASAFQ